ncbi:hypothetical protein QVD17_36205 [Tagetes erecta]|uniref:Uncharacterized protein n=1 Tax=Tagetes erecta TaxID=13708 RepID=A0AAD8JVW9_TARER|nr:hypothetical protein QVD17_36205 [Tagetes erecta]
MEADLTQRAADFKQYMLQVLKEIDQDKDFMAMTGRKYELKKRTIISALEELSRKHKSLADSYAHLINNKSLKKRLLGASSFELTQCLTHLQDNVVGFEEGVNNSEIKSRLRELPWLYNSLVNSLRKNLADSKSSSEKIKTLEDEVNRMKSKFKETELRLLTFYHSAEEQISVRNVRVGNVQGQLNEIKKELYELTPKVFKNAIHIRRCKETQEPLEQTILDETQTHLTAISSFRQRLIALEIPQLLDSFHDEQILWDANKGGILLELTTISEVVNETLLEVELLKDSDDVTDRCFISEELKNLNLSLSQKMWSFTDLPIRSIGDELKDKVLNLENKVLEQKEFLEAYTSV